MPVVLTMIERSPQEFEAAVAFHSLFQPVVTGAIGLQQNKRGDEAAAGTASDGRVLKF